MATSNYFLIIEAWRVLSSSFFQPGRGRAESESGSISRPAWLEGRSISQPTRLESGPARVLDAGRLSTKAIGSLINCLHEYDYKSMRESS